MMGSQNTELPGLGKDGKRWEHVGKYGKIMETYGKHMGNIEETHEKHMENMGKRTTLPLLKVF